MISPSTVNGAWVSVLAREDDWNRPGRAGFETCNRLVMAIRLASITGARTR